MSPGITHGDFTTLAKDYARFRAGYSETVLSALLGLTRRPPERLDCVDVGAGTGIWSRMLARRGCRTVAIEPNAEMRRWGVASSSDLPITWYAGSAESTGLESGCCDLVTMASAFHWADFDQATDEFARLLRPGGWMAALWNPRVIESQLLFVEIEDKLRSLVPDMKRVSSGRSAFCSNLAERLRESPHFDEVITFQARHVERMTPARYIGLWRSVNDARVQAGPERFETFLRYVEERVSSLPYIEATYETPMWAAHLRDDG